ncbi:MAG TPA: NUDIX domain-containing protein [Longimicrobiales bacterium]|nr:NUDIX domain-containing protein [Longimicrobiales bacterium]
MPAADDPRPATAADAGEIPVLAAVIRRGERYLLCRRPAHKRHGGLWEFPGGKLEPGETHAAAARRELAEELGVVAERAGDVAWSVRDPGSVFRIEFVPVSAAGEPQPLEHSALTWVTLAEALALPLAPSDRRFVEWVLAGAGGVSPPAG